MNIQSSSFYVPVEKTIKPYQCGMIATEGPNVVERIDLAGLSIPYDDANVSKIKLFAGKKDYPILMQENATFLLIRVKYDSSDPTCVIEEDNYIEYYFESTPLEIRYIGEYMVLTGNINHRLPKVYLNNPSDRDVLVDIMSATQILESDSEDSNIIRIENIYYNSIISDQIGYGSTEFHFIDANADVVLILPYINIASIDKTPGSSTIVINTNSNERILLEFVSEFNAYQGLSRIEWVLRDQLNRQLTVSYPSVDITPPVIAYNTTGYTFQTTGITMSELRSYYLSSVTDLRDGGISTDNVNIYILEKNQNVFLTGITHQGEYTIIFEVYDTANNKVSDQKDIIVDITPPVIYFYPIASGSGFTMDLTGDTYTPGQINKSDIILKSVDNIIDNVDGLIANSALTLTITSGLTTLTAITNAGYYNVNYYVADRVGNSATTDKVVFVKDTEDPVIVFTLQSSGDTMVLSDYSGSISTTDVLNYYVSAVTDNYDQSLTVSSVVVLIDGGVTPITVATNYTITLELTDASSNVVSYTRILSVV